MYDPVLDNNLLIDWLNFESGFHPVQIILKLALWLKMTLNFWSPAPSSLVLGPGITYVFPHTQLSAVLGHHFTYCNLSLAWQYLN